MANPEWVDGRSEVDLPPMTPSEPAPREQRAHTFLGRLAQGVLDGMLTTGRLRLIRDGELRTALSAWGVLADMTEDEVASRELVMAQLEPLLWRLMDVRSIRSYELLLGAPWQAMAAMSQVPVDRELIGILASRRYWQHHTMRELSGPRQEARRILGLIERSAGEAPR